MNRKRISLAVFTALLAVVAVCIYRYSSWLDLVENEAQLRARIAHHPLLAALIGFGVYTALSLVPGTGGKSVVFGWLFGLWWGVTIVNCALTAAAMITFWFSRYVFRDAVQSRFGYYIQRLDRALRRDGASYLLLLRVLHFPYTFTNYAMGATAIRTRNFWCASQIGMLPGNFVFVYAGAQAPSLSALAEQGVSGVLTVELLGALLVLSLFPLAVRYLISRCWPAAFQEHDED